MKKTLLFLLLSAATFIQAQDKRITFAANTPNNRGQFTTVATPQTSVGWIQPTECQFDQTTFRFGGYSGTGTRIATLASDGTLGSLPQSTFMLTTTANDSLSAMRTTMTTKANASNVYTKSASDALYKAIGWFPTWSEVTGKPTLFSGVYADLTGKPTQFSGAYADLSGKPTLFDGVYGSLSGKPDLSVYYLASNPSGYITGFTEVDPNVPAYAKTLSAFSVIKTSADALYQPIGSYITSETDPTVPAYSKTLSAFTVIKTSTDALYQPIGTYATASNSMTFTNKSGSNLMWTNDANYTTTAATDLLYRPITYAPTFASITSKPTTLSGYGITDAYPLSGNPAGYLTSIAAQSFASLTGKPTTLSGYGITDAATSAQGTKADTALQAEVDGSITNEIEVAAQAGQSGKYLTTNGTITSWGTPSTTPSGAAGGQLSGTYPNPTVIATTGTTAVGNAAAGNVGEYIESKIATGSAVSLSNGATNNVTSISLTAGDWDVEASVVYNSGAATVTGKTTGISLTSTTLPTDGSEVASGLLQTLITGKDGATIPRKRVNVSSTTTVYLVANCAFSLGTVGAYGVINARRVR